MKKLAFVAYGGIAYGVFIASFLYAIGFVGNRVVPKSIDSCPCTTTPGALILNLSLLSLFAVQHSVMARQGFKAMWTQMIAPSVERSTYVLISSVLLGLIMWKWKAIPGVIWDISSPALIVALNALYWLGWLIALVSTFLISHVDLFGLRQVILNMRGVEYTPVKFAENALYRVVRHPLYLGFVIAFWVTPHMSLGHFTFAVATTGYILVGIFFEERDLMKIHPSEYGAYRARVRMLFPIGGKR